MAVRNGSRWWSDGKLPRLSEGVAPGWRLIQHVVRTILIGSAAVVVVGVAGMAVGSEEVPANGRAVIERADACLVRTARSGVMKAVYVTAGELVSKGQVLARLDVMDGIAESEEARSWTIRAPAPGVIDNGYVDRMIGAEVAAGSVIFGIRCAKAWRAVIFVAESDASRFELGDEVSIVQKGSSNVQPLAFVGEVAAVAAAPVGGKQDGGSGAGQYRVEIALDTDMADVDGGVTWPSDSVAVSARSGVGRIGRVLWRKAAGALHIGR